MINIDDFLKIEMRVGLITEATKLAESNKLILMKVVFDEDDARTVVSGIAKHYSPEDLINNKFMFITNLEPRKILEYESQAMIVAAHNEDTISLLKPEKDIETGSAIS
jgi:methionine--tRNA ligase beta chain